LELLKKRIKEINSLVEIIETQQSVVNLDKILGIKAFNIDNVLILEPNFLIDTDHQHD